MSLLAGGLAMPEEMEQKTAETTEQEHHDNGAMKLRQSIVDGYMKEGLSEKEAGEKADEFIRANLFRPHAADIDPQVAGLTERAAGDARQQAAEKESVEQEKAAEKVKEAPARQDERKPANMATVRRYAHELKEIAGEKWAFKDAEHSGLKINNLSIASTPELVEKLDKRHIRYFPINKGGEKFIAIDTDQELHLTNKEINDRKRSWESDMTKENGKFLTYAETLKKITGKDWSESDKEDRIASTPELVATLEEKNVRYKTVKEGDKEFLSVSKNESVFLQDWEKDRKRYREELNAMTGADWERKDNILRVPATPELAAKLEEKGVRYTDDDNILEGKRFLEVDSRKPFYLTNEEINKKTYAAELSKITGAEWDATWRLDPNDILKQKESLCVVKTPEMIAKLEEKGIRYDKLQENENIIAVDLDKPLYLTEKEMEEKKNTKEPVVAAKEAESAVEEVEAPAAEAPAKEAEAAVEEVEAPVAEAPAKEAEAAVEEVEAPVAEAPAKEAKAPVEEEKEGKESADPAAKAKAGKEAEEDAPVFSAGPDKSFLNEKQEEKDDQEKNAELEELKEQLLRTAWKNKFLALEDEEANEGLADDKKHLCPFGQILPDSLKINKDPAYATMKTEKGSTLLNASKRVHMDYEGDKPSFEDCIAMARLGMEKGWKTAKLEGSEEYKAQMYLAMRAMGIKAIGYTPSPELEKQGDEMAAQYKQDREHAESMDQRYPALEEARGDTKFKNVDLDKYKEIRAKAEGKDTAEQTKDAKEAEAPAAEKPAKEAEAPAPEKPAKEAEAPAAEKPAKEAEAPAAEKPAKEAPAVGKVPEGKKAELNGKFDQMVSKMAQQHPGFSSNLLFGLSKTETKEKTPSPSDLLKAYGNAMASVKKAEAKEATNKVDLSKVMNAAKNRSGEGR